MILIRVLRVSQSQWEVTNYHVLSFSRGQEGSCRINYSFRLKLTHLKAINPDFIIKPFLVVMDQGDLLRPYPSLRKSFSGMEM